MFDILDSLLATASVVLGLSLIVQAIQQIIKQWLDLKSNYMRVQLLAMFDSPSIESEFRFHGLWNVNFLSERADSSAKLIVDQLENVMRSFGYKNLEVLEYLNAEKLKEILAAIPWHDKTVNIAKIKKDVDAWFEIALKGFQDLYERRMKLWAFMISAVVVIVMNANIFDVYKEFSVNKPLRDAAVAWMEKTIAQPRDSIISVSQPNIKDSITTIKKSDEQIAEDIKADFAFIQNAMREQSFQLFRWTKPYRDALFSGSSPLLRNWIKSLLGWLGMTLLVSLGSPFWYDILKAIMGLKNKTKATE
jgi:hypothetical protein